MCLSGVLVELLSFLRWLLTEYNSLVTGAEGCEGFTIGQRGRDEVHGSAILRGQGMQYVNNIGEAIGLQSTTSNVW